MGYTAQSVAPRRPPAKQTSLDHFRVQVGYVESVTVLETTMPSVPRSARPQRRRLPEFDVVRALVLVGVFTMNYIVYWRTDRLRGGWPGEDAPGWLATFIHPWSGPLSTRFAATLVTLVGIGVELGARPAVASGGAVTVDQHRWRLRRRGVLFILVGVMFDAAWAGGVLHYVGTYLIVISFMITWKTRRLILAALVVIALTIAERVAVFLIVDPAKASWWNGIDSRSFRRFSVGTPQGYLSSVLSWGGHPVLPWLAFVLAGMVLARVLVRDQDSFGVPQRRLRLLRLQVVGCGLGLMATGFGFAMVANSLVTSRWRWISSLDPVGGGASPFGLAMPAYVFSAMGSSIISITVITWIAQKTATWLPTRVLARAGRVTFSLYVLHGLIPWVLTVHGIVKPDFTLYQSLGIAIGGWALAVVLGALYQRWRGIGPMEWLLRKIGG